MIYLVSILISAKVWETAFAVAYFGHHPSGFGVAFSNAIKAILEPIMQFLTRNRRHLKESRERQAALNVFWWTRNMRGDDAWMFIFANGGGLLSGASFEKDWRWDIFQRTGRVLPMEEKPIQK